MTEKDAVSRGTRPGSAARPVTRGRWLFHPGVHVWCGMSISAWELEGTGWWLRRRSGAAQCLKWCGYCWREPYGWWQLHRCSPGEWLILSPPNPYWMHALHGLNRHEQRLFAWPPAWEKGHGACTHRHLLKDAMAVVEKAYDEHLLKTLAEMMPSLDGKAKERRP